MAKLHTLVHIYIHILHGTTPKLHLLEAIVLFVEEFVCLPDFVRIPGEHCPNRHVAESSLVVVDGHVLRPRRDVSLDRDRHRDCCCQRCVAARWVVIDEDWYQVLVPVKRRSRVAGAGGYDAPLVVTLTRRV